MAELSRDADASVGAELSRRAVVGGSSSAAEPAFCRPRDATARLAVLGVLGVESQSAVRLAIRNTCLPGGAAADILALFALRGVGIRQSTADEAARHGDVVFLRAHTEQSRFTGPLWSAWLWFECALDAWPGAQLIGKAESDVWVHLPGVAARIQRDFDALRRRAAARSTRGAAGGAPPPSAPPSIYWGIMETFQWDLKLQRPRGFAYKFGATNLNCTVRQVTGNDRAGRVEFKQLRLPPNASSAYATLFVGPFCFAKGPLVFVSRAPLLEVVRPGSFASHSLLQVARQVSDSNAAELQAIGGYPQDDAWLGLALATSVHARRSNAPPLVSIHAGSVIYAEAITDRAYPLHSTTLVWHNGHALNKFDTAHPNSSGLPGRIESLHALMQRTPSRCETPSVTLNCLSDSPPKREFHSCAGAHWDRCLVVHVRASRDRRRRATHTRGLDADAAHSSRLCEAMCGAVHPSSDTEPRVARARPQDYDRCPKVRLRLTPT